MLGIHRVSTNKQHVESSTESKLEIRPMSFCRIGNRTIENQFDIGLKMRKTMFQPVVILEPSKLCTLE